MIFNEVGEQSNILEPSFSNGAAYADLDNDGDLDVFFGNGDGDITYVENTGSSSTPAFDNTNSSSNPFGLDDVGLFSSPEFADIDGDGDLDAFIGEYDGNTIYFKNTGTASNPVFDTANSSTNPYGLSDVGSFASSVAYGSDEPATETSSMSKSLYPHDD